MQLSVINMNSLLDENLIDLYRDEIMRFSSPDNEDVERFLKQNSENFCRMKQAVTYLVIDYENNKLLAYFTLALKIMEFPTENLSKAMLKILERNGNHTDNTIQSKSQEFFLRNGVKIFHTKKTLFLEIS